MRNMNIIVYDTRDGNAFLADHEKRDSGNPAPLGKLHVELGKHATLTDAVGNARQLGHHVDGWMRPDVQVILDVKAIRTPHDLDHFKGRFTGVDNDGEPKADYLLKISNMSDEQLAKACESKIWLSAYANNNPRSDYHWHADALGMECDHRKRPEIYQEAWERARRTA